MTTANAAANADVSGGRSLLDRLVPRNAIRRRAWLAAVLACYDSLATWLWVRLEVGSELNPLVDSVMSRFGAGTGLVVRAVYVVALIAMLAYMAEGRRSKTMRGFLATVLVGMIGISIYHTGFGVVFAVYAALGWI
ncbi:DUF5658 family protein [Euzebya pacifica]|uniref:DUF5658 family protein n=1 Tax=Euzebya pacifica TaxID=1608957 RepID=UPI001C1F8CDB|nr:DUF5658 family protein [Euzebya pacifica]